MRLLVTGGAGYIGSVVTAMLIEEGHEVTVVDNLSKGHREQVPDAAVFVEADLLDPDGLSSAFEGDLDGVLHFAARSLVGESVQQPVGYYRTNVAGTANLLDAMKRNDVSRLVFSSTAAVYGEPDEIPIREDAPTLPTNPYGASKLAVDHLIGYAAAADGATAASLRYFNVAGAYGRYGEIHDPETHVIPVLLDVASGRRDGFKVFGTDYETDDGTAVRDYVHVEDLARAHLFALERAAPGSHSIYNLGNGRGFSVNEVLEAARSVTKRAIPAEEVGRRAGDPPVLVASSAKAESELGWKRVKPSLEEMIEDAWRFHRSSLA